MIGLIDMLILIGIPFSFHGRGYPCYITWKGIPLLYNRKGDTPAILHERGYPCYNTWKGIPLLYYMEGDTPAINVKGETPAILYLLGEYTFGKLL